MLAEAWSLSVDGDLKLSVVVVVVVVVIVVLLLLHRSALAPRTKAIDTETRFFQNTRASFTWIRGWAFFLPSRDAYPQAASMSAGNFFFV